MIGVGGDVADRSRSSRAAVSTGEEEAFARSSRSDIAAYWVPVAATGAAFFMIVLDTSIVNLALARIGRDLHAGLTTLQWLIDGYALVFASLLLGAGALGDRFGAKASFMCGLLVFSLASAACALAPDIATLQISRVVQGLGAALLLPNSLATLNHTFADPARRSKAVAAWASAGALGVALGPVLGGVLVTAFGWRSIFIVNVPVGLLALWLTQRQIPDAPRDRSRAFDAVGQVLAVATLATATYAMIGINRPASSAVPSWASGAACVIFALCFVVVEIWRRKPMLPLPLLGRRTLGPVSLVGMLHNLAVYGIIFVLSLAYQELRGLTPLDAGLLFLPLTAALAIGTRVGAILLRKHGPFRPLIGGHFVAAVGALMLGTLAHLLPLAALAVPLFIIGAGAGITTPAMNLAVLDSVERTQSGLASGILNSARQTGGVIGVALLGALLGEPMTVAGAQVAIYVATGVLCLASGLALAASWADRQNAAKPATCGEVE
jgi:MFS transporter, DHA2 family, methylenomycin A resistance protein